MAARLSAKKLLLCAIQEIFHQSHGTYGSPRVVKYYNHQRLHSSLAYRSPVAYEQQAA